MLLLMVQAQHDERVVARVEASRDEVAHPLVDVVAVLADLGGTRAREVAAAGTVEARPDDS